MLLAVWIAVTVIVAFVIGVVALFALEPGQKAARRAYERRQRSDCA